MPHPMDLFTSTPGLDPRLFGIMESLGELGRLVRSLLLQSFAFANGILQLLLYFGHPSFVLAAGILLGLQFGSRLVSGCLIRLRLFFGLAKGAFEGLDLGCASCDYNQGIP